MELVYIPVLADANAFVASLPGCSLLIVGASVPASVETTSECRLLAPPPEVSLATGSYGFRVEDGWAVMVVEDGALPSAPSNATWNDPDEHPLLQAYSWYCEWWTAARPVAKPRFRERDTVMLPATGQNGVIKKRSYSNGRWRYDVRIGHQTPSLVESDLSELIDDDDPYEWVTRSDGGAERFAATLTRAKLSQHLTDTVYSLRASRTIFRPYQFRPVIRLLEAPRPRLLIADEVGLGKTIEAGLVWTELDARGQADRVLILCPSTLVPKWCREMDERFGYELTELDRGGLDGFLDQLERDALPSRFRWICSIERMRMWAGLERAAELAPRFDLVVVDEAQALRNRGTRSFELAQHLSLWADAMVFLSATPLNLGNDDLYNLLDSLAPGEFENRDDLIERLEPNAVLNRVGASLFNRSIAPAQRLSWLDDLQHLAFGPSVMRRPEFNELRHLLQTEHLSGRDVVEAKRLIASLHALSAVITRTRKVEVEDQKAIREPVSIPVEWTDAERRFYEAVERWIRQRARQLDQPIGFATQMPLRLVSSCLPTARARFLGEQRETLGSELEDADGEGLEAGQELFDFDSWMAGTLPDEVRQAAIAVGDVDTKFDSFVEHLRPVLEEGRRVLIFSTFRPVVAYLERRLAEVCRVAVMHGDVERNERHELIRRFRQGEFDVMVASRVASEGLDFEFCSVVVNYDLPWNPMEVEQRIGRVDRFGQTEEKIYVLNFVTPGTIETEIFLRVLQRIGIFNDSVGELEPILLPQLDALRSLMLDFRLSDEERETKLRVVEAALEGQKAALRDLEENAGALASADQVEVDGIENNLLSTGKYIGSTELLLLLKDWVASSAGARINVSSDGKYVSIIGTAEMERQLLEVQSAGERSAAEIAQYARNLRNEQAIMLCLDQETARLTGAPLIGPNHPLVRAALRVQAYANVRYASVSASSNVVPAGRYLVLLALADWRGIRKSTEFWTSAVDLASLKPADDAIGDILFSALAKGELRAGPPLVGTDVSGALSRAQSLLQDRADDERDRRQQENDALIDVRLTSLRQSHDRKVAQVRRAATTLLAAGNERMAALQQSQIHASELRLHEAERAIELARNTLLSPTYVAACVLEVVQEIEEAGNDR